MRPCAKNTRAVNPSSCWPPTSATGSGCCSVCRSSACRWTPRTSRCWTAGRRCEMRKLRSVFGARMIPAQELLGDIIKQRGTPRTIAILADQEPKAGERKQWVRFLNRDSAFFIGPEEIARATRCRGVFREPEARFARPLRSGVRAHRRGRRAAAERRIHRPLCAHGRGRRFAPRRPTGRGRTSGGN